MRRNRKDFGAGVSERGGMTRGTRTRRILLLLLGIMVPAVIIPIARGTAVTSSTSYYAQVAAQSTDPTDHYANGFETYLGRFPVPQSEPNLTYVYFWVGSTLADGSFYQVGLATDVPGCPTQMQIFTFGFYPDGTTTSDFVNCGTTISTFAAFSSFEYRSLPNGVYEWLSSGSNGLIPGSGFYPHAANIGNNVPAAVGELQSVAPITSSNQMGPEGFCPTLRTEFGSTWYPSRSAAARYWYTASCPPQNVTYFANSNNWTSIGTGLGGTCTPNGAALW